MAQGDFGVVPNVWRPQFVPPINTGEDTQAGIPGNSAANLGATETTIVDSFFNVPLVGWQKSKEVQNITVTSAAFATAASFTLDTRTPRHMFLIEFVGKPALANLTLRFNSTTPYTGSFGTLASASGNNQVGYYAYIFSTLANLTYGVAVPITIARVTAVLNQEGGVMYDLTAGSVQTLGQSSFLLAAVNNGAGTDATFAINLSGDIDTSIPIDVEAKVTAGSATLTRIILYQLGDRLLAATT